MIPCMRGTLGHFDLHHMDFPDGPAAIHWSRTTYAKPTKAASPNELINPEISMKNHHIFIYCFLWFGPAIFHASIISFCACIVLLLNKIFEPCLIHNVRQHNENAPETSPNPLLMFSNVEIHHICNCDKSLVHFNLAHMDFPSCPAALHWSTMTSSKPT